MKILDVGCGKNKLPGAIGMDKYMEKEVDVVHDADKLPYPFPNESFNYIYCSHLIEHLYNPENIINESHRLLKPRGELCIRCPHYSSSAAWGNLPHKRTFGYFSFDCVTRGDEGLAKMRIESRRLIFGRAWQLLGIERLANFFPMFYEEFLSGVFKAREIEVCLQKQG